MLKLIELENELRTKVVLCSFGASIYDIKTIDKNGVCESIVATPRDENEFMYSKGYFGKTIGRTAGRIENSRFVLNGKEYNIISEDFNGLHGGKDSIAFKEFDVDVMEKNDYYKVVFNYYSKDMESGFPSDVDITVTYIFYKRENRLEVIYEAITNMDTLMNLTNHTYFNLSGNSKSNILEHKLFINAGTMGKLVDMIPKDIVVCSEKYSFINNHKIGQYIMDKEIIDSANGYDFPYVFDDKSIDLDNIILEDEDSGRSLKISTSYPCVVVYTCNYPSNIIVKNSNNKLLQYGGICLECQYFPNAINSDFIENKKEILKKNEKYFNKIIYKFN